LRLQLYQPVAKTRVPAGENTGIEVGNLLRFKLSHRVLFCVIMISFAPVKQLFDADFLSFKDLSMVDVRDKS